MLKSPQGGKSYEKMDSASGRGRTVDFRSGLHIVLRTLGGLFSFKALAVFKSLADSLNWWGEIAVVLLVFCCCLLGFLAGLVHRRLHPDPYRPRFSRRF